MKTITKTIQDVLESILNLVKGIFRMIGLGGGDGGGRQVAPKAPTANDAKAQAKDKSGMSPGRSMDMSPAQKVIAYVALAKDERQKFDLTGLSPIQQAWLRGADNDVLKEMSKMQPKEALAFFLKETSKTKGSMYKPMKQTAPSSAAVHEAEPEARRPRRKPMERAPGRRPAPAFAMAM